MLSRRSLFQSQISSIFTRTACYTDGNGPDVFRKCSKLFVLPYDDNSTSEGATGEQEYNTPFGHGQCVTGVLPPSSQNEICKNFHKKIENIRHANPLEEIDEKFVKQFLSTPAETLLIPSSEIKLVIWQMILY